MNIFRHGAAKLMEWLSEETLTCIALDPKLWDTDDEELYYICYACWYSETVVDFMSAKKVLEVYFGVLVRAPAMIVFKRILLHKAKKAERA